MDLLSYVLTSAMQRSHLAQIRHGDPWQVAMQLRIRHVTVVGDSELVCRQVLASARALVCASLRARLIIPAA